MRVSSKIDWLQLGVSATTVLACAIYLATPALFAWFFLGSSDGRTYDGSFLGAGDCLLSVWNGTRYAATSSFLQVAVAFCVAYTFTVRVRKRRGRIAQLAIDLLILLPYIVPSVCWRWISTDIMGADRGFLGIFIDTKVVGEPTVSYIECQFASVIHLFPFSYLAFRFYLSKLDGRVAAFAETLGLRGVAFHLRYNVGSFLRLTALLFVLRFMIMIGKFDLPYLFSGGAPKPDNLLYTLPLWVDHRIGLEGLSVATSAVGLLFFIMIASIAIVLILARGLVKAGSDFNAPAIRFARSAHRVIASHAPSPLARVFGIGAIIATKCIGLFFGVIGIVFLSVFLWRHMSLQSLIEIWAVHGYMKSLLISLSVILLLGMTSVIIALSVKMAMAGKQGWGIWFVFWASLSYFAVPPAVYLSFAAISDAAAPYLAYGIFLIASVTPLAICQLHSGIPNLESERYLFMKGLSSSFPKSFVRAHRQEINRALPVVALAVVVVQTNDLFGARHLLTEPPYPLSRFLWDSRNLFHGDLGMTMAAASPVVLVNLAVLGVLGWLTMSSNTDDASGTNQTHR